MSSNVLLSLRLNSSCVFEQLSSRFGRSCAFVAPYQIFVSSRVLGKGMCVLNNNQVISTS